MSSSLPNPSNLLDFLVLIILYKEFRHNLNLKVNIKPKFTPKIFWDIATLVLSAIAGTKRKLRTLMLIPYFTIF